MISPIFVEDKTVPSIDSIAKEVYIKKAIKALGHIYEDDEGTGLCKVPERSKINYLLPYWSTIVGLCSKKLCDL
jgi:hypothetical protein